MEVLILTFTTLFSVVNPFGAMPVFLTLTDDDSGNAERTAIARRACLYMVAILTRGLFGRAVHS
ncbi:MAG: MarC family protein [Hymenobacter sp.]